MKMLRYSLFLTALLSCTHVWAAEEGVCTFPAATWENNQQASPMYCFPADAPALGCWDAVKKAERICTLFNNPLILVDGTTCDVALTQAAATCYLQGKRQLKDQLNDLKTRYVQSYENSPKKTVAITTGAALLSLIVLCKLAESAVATKPAVE